MSDYRTMLDTNIVSDLIRDPAGRAARRLRAHGDDGICVSIIAVAELRYGVAKKASARLASRVETVLSALDILPFDVPCDRAYGDIRADLAALGEPIGPTDIFIAAHAASLGLMLVTDNVREFGKVRGLKVENWLT